jgi:hypothetical protein
MNDGISPTPTHATASGARTLAAATLAIVAAIATNAITATPSLAQPHESDIILRVDNDAIRTGALTPGGFEERRVFVGELGFIAPNFTSDPGFDCFPGTFPVGTAIGFSIHDALRKWNGSDFSMIPPERMLIERGSLAALSPRSPETVTGFTLSVASNGQWHRHYEYTLQAPASDGVYLLQASLFSTAPAIGESSPFWLLFDQNAPDADVLAASQWVLDNLVSPPTACDSIDFNNDGVFPDNQDAIDFIEVFGGAPCPNPIAPCNDIDFNNDSIFPDNADVIRFLEVFAGSPC